MQTARPSSTAAGAQSGSVRGLSALLLGATLVGVMLWWLDGPPRLPAGWERIAETLARSQLTEAEARATAAAVGWAALGYLALATALRLLVAMAIALSSGASWARSAQRLSDLVTLPLVRRAVDGSIAGLLLVASAAPAARSVRAETADQVGFAAPPRQMIASAVPSHGEWATRASDEQAVSVRYEVVRGDSLWEIARRFYGDGSRYVELFEVNRDRVMGDGTVFSDPRLISPGWVLAIPLPAAQLSVEDGRTYYRVQPGDHLWGIATRLLGDGFRWVELWELNRDGELRGGGRLVHPDRIAPGWLLALPLPTSTAAVAAADRPPGSTTVPPRTASPATRPTAEPVRVTPVATAKGAEEPNLPIWSWPALPAPVRWSAAGFAILGGTVIFVERLRRARALRLPGRRGESHEPGDAGRVALAARALRLALADFDFAASRPVMVVESAGALAFEVECPVGDAEALVAHRYELGRRLACRVDAELINARRVRLRLAGFQRLAGLLTEGPALAVLPVPVGASADGIVYVDLAAVGSITIAGAERERTRLAAGWLRTLAATHSAAELAFRMDAPMAASLGDLEELPHFAGALPASDTDALIREFEQLVHAREGDATTTMPVLALIDATNVDPEHIESVLRRGPAVGVYAVALGDRVLTIKSGASVELEALSDDEADSDDAGRPAPLPGELALIVGGAVPLFLEPVRVRADRSSRWTDDATAAFPHAGTIEDTAARNAEGGGEDSPFADDRGEDHDTGEPHQPDTTPPPPPEPLAAAGDGELAPAPFALATPGAVLAPVSEQAGDPQLALAPASSRAEPTPSLRVEWQEPLFPQDDDSTGDAPLGAQYVSVRCFGGLQVQVGGRPTSSWPLQKSRELLAYLIARGGDAVPRDEVGEALWPDETPSHIERLLADAAYRLRKTLKQALPEGGETQFFTTQGQRYRLHAHVFRVDVDAFNARLRRARTLEGAAALREYERALALNRGDFLGRDGYQWAEPWRQEYRRRFAAASREAARLAGELREPEKAAALYEAILDRDPLDEEATRALMRCHAQRGDSGAVRRTYRSLEQALKLELEDDGAEPAPQTQLLLRELTARPGAA